MIIKIGTINSLGVFKGFKWDDCVKDEKDRPLHFKKRNAIFGCNYSGKTTLSRIFRALELHQLPEKFHKPQFEVVTDKEEIITQDAVSLSKLTVRVFNEDYVQKNLRFFTDPDGEIEPFAILGVENKEVEAAIEVLEAEIGNDDGELSTGLFKLLNETKREAAKVDEEFAKANEYLDKTLGNKATGTGGIKNNHRKYGDINYTIIKLRSDIEEVMYPDFKVLSVEEVRRLETTINEQEKAELKQIQLEESRIENLCKQSATLLSSKIGTSSKIQSLINDVVLESWVRQGVSIHRDKEICLFCGSKIPSERWKAIATHFDEESKKLEDGLALLIAQVEMEKSGYISPLVIDKASYYTSFHGQIDECIQKYNELRLLQCQSLDQVIDQLQRRKIQITVPFEFRTPKDYYVAIRDVVSILNRLILDNNAFSKQLSLRNAEVQKKLRLQEVADFCNIIDYKELKRRLSELEAKKGEVNRRANDVSIQLQHKQEELKGKKSLLNDEEEGARCVNHYLSSSFGCNHIKLVCKEVNDGDKRYRFEVVRGDIPASNMSEGERRLISFCYFITRLKDEMNRGIKPIIWIDDPISSLDGNHIFFIYSLIKSEIVVPDKYEQLFISTHNLEFLKYLKRLECNNDSDLECFIVRRRDQNSEIAKMPQYMRKYVTEFNYLFQEIYKCSRMESIDDDNYSRIYSFGNTARKFLEVLMFFNYPDNDTQLNKLQKYFGADKVPAIVVEKANNEYSHLEGNLERAGLPIEAPEIIQISKLIVDTMREKNPGQYESLLRSIS